MRFLYVSEIQSKNLGVGKLPEVPFPIGRIKRNSIRELKNYVVISEVPLLADILLQGSSVE